MQSQPQEFEIIESNSFTYYKCKCGNEQRIYALDQAELVACMRCKTVCSITTNKKIISYAKRTNPYAYLQVGRKGKLDGLEFTVIGVSLKVNKGYFSDIWVEYVLIDSNNEMTYLAQASGNYTWYKKKPKDLFDGLLNKKTQEIEYDGQCFYKLDSYSYTTKFLTGEFPDNMGIRKNTTLADYIAPPNVITVETHGIEINYYLGKHFTRKEISNIFSEPRIATIIQEGIGVAEPFYGNLNVSKFTQLSGAFLVLFLLLFIALAGFGHLTKKTELIFDHVYSWQDENNALVTPSFVIEPADAPAYLEFNGRIALDNEWVEFGIELVNENTGISRTIGLPLELYSGVEGGESWVEGSCSDNVNLNQVEAGVYHLRISTFTNYSLAGKNLHLAVAKELPLYWNVGIIVFPYLLFIILLNVLNRQYERVRKGEIDHIFDSES